jgi:cytochrome c556
VQAQSPEQLVRDVIIARKDLMNQAAATLAQAQEQAKVATEVTPELYEDALAVTASLEAFAHLFPDSSNLLGGAPSVGGDVTTTANAQVWTDFSAFYGLVHDAADQARLAADAPSIADYTAALDGLQATCSSCHATYVEYDPFAAVN